MINRLIDCTEHWENVFKDELTGIIVTFNNIIL